MLRVTVRKSGSSDSKTHSFQTTELFLGRDPTLDLPLVGTGVSKRHARIVIQGSKVFLVDLKSTNGTYVNGQKITAPCALNPDDKIAVGDFRLSVARDDEGGIDARFTALWLDGVQAPLIGSSFRVRISGRCAEVATTVRYSPRAPSSESILSIVPDHFGKLVSVTFSVGQRRWFTRLDPTANNTTVTKSDWPEVLNKGAIRIHEHHDDVWLISLGPLLAGPVVEATFRYVTLLSSIEKGGRFCIPQSVVPVSSVQLSQSERETIEGYTGLDMVLDIAAPSPLQWVESLSHKIETEWHSHGIRIRHRNALPGLHQDFSLSILRKRPHEPFARYALESDGSRVVAIEFQPDPQALPITYKEVWIFIDASTDRTLASEQARTALSLCLRSLSEGDTLNLVRLGRTITPLWSSAQVYDRAHFEEALQFLSRTQDTEQNIDVRSAFSMMLSQPVDPHRPRQLLWIAKSASPDTDALVTLVAQKASEFRCFSVDLGTADQSLLQTLAQKTNGHYARFSALPQASGSTSRVEPLILEQWARVCAPALANIQIDWLDAKVDQAPSRCNTVFAGQSLLVVGKIHSGNPAVVVLSSAARSWQLALDYDTPEPGGGPVPLTWAWLRSTDTAPLDQPTRERIQRYGLTDGPSVFTAVSAQTPTQDASLNRLRPPVLVRAVDVQTASTISDMDRPSEVVSSGPSAAITLNSSPRTIPPSAQVTMNTQGSNPIVSASNTQIDLLYELLATQQVDGAFPPSPALRKWLGLQAQSVEQASAPDRAGILTSVVVVLLETNASNRAVEWSAAVAKAKRFLAAHQTSYDVRPLLGIK